MKKQTHARTNYIPLLIAVLTVTGTITVGVFNILNNQNAIDVNLKWLKDEAKDTKIKLENISKDISGINLEIEKLRHSVNISDTSINDIFMELLDRLETSKVK